MTYSDNCDSESDIESEYNNYFTSKSSTESYHDWYCDDCGSSVDDFRDMTICDCNLRICIECEGFLKKKCRRCDDDMCSICVSKTNCYKCKQHYCRHCIEKCKKCKRYICSDCDQHLKCRKICYYCKERAANTL